MSVVRPFRAVRPAKELADKVISLPYDVMNREEAASMADENKYSFLHICRSEIDLPEEENPYAESVYQKAKSNINQFLSQGILIRDEKPMFYIYRQTMDGRIQTGIVATVSIDDYINNIIKKHEFTRVEKELDRINHFEVCNTNTEPVFLTYRDDESLRTLINKWVDDHDPEYDFITEDKIGHTLWVISDENVNGEISKRFENIPYLYIADGHHRSASAAKVGLKLREKNPQYTGMEEFNFFMAVIFPDNDLKVFDYNRVVRDLNGLSQDEFLMKVKENFAVEIVGDAKASPYAPDQKHTFSMFLGSEWYKLTPNTEIINEDDVISSLDVSILQDYILNPILGIKDPRLDKRIDFIGGIRGLGELKRRVELDMKVAFAVYPVSVSDLFKVADQNQVMPPKSTWFEPKLGSGLFMHEL